MMEPLFVDDRRTSPQVRDGAREAQRRKGNGVHYTPRELAAFLAGQVIARLGSTECHVLDPACGDAELLVAVAETAARTDAPAPHLVGIDLDPIAVERAQERLENVRAASVSLSCGDFLTEATPTGRQSSPVYDAVISNPPYVRTQILGAARAQELADRYGLKGRVDLYHAFVAAMTQRLKSRGVLGLLCSNRFLTTRTGQSLRALLLDAYDLQELWDLGDTKLFEAAVLPAIVIARRTRASAPRQCSFVRVYERNDPGIDAPAASSLTAVLQDGLEGPVQLYGRCFELERGALAEHTAERPWRIASPRASRWLKTVMRRSAGRFGDLSPVRVGIKTTADKVFIRASWDDLPEAMRPEEELLRPLRTHRVAARWRAQDDDGTNSRLVLYPHETRDGRRQPVDLEAFPRARAYLEQYRDRLEGRTYVLKAGRQWYEIWVPQQPDGWAGPKLVWPDISDRPRFFLDSTDAIVNGDCYWLSCVTVPHEQMALALAVANSSFALQYYDLCCGNRLYAGRRRFITQYVEELPLPHASAGELRQITAMVEQLCEPHENGSTGAAVADTLDRTVWELFGLEEVLRKP